MGITVNEIAELCGVSRTTVLRALNNQSRVGEETKKRILSVANEYGYRPNLLARSLNSGRSMTIGVLVIDVENMAFVQSLSAINREAEKRGFFSNIVLHGSNNESEIKRIQNLVDRRVDGILISPLNKGEKFNNFLLSLGIPVVCIGNFVSNEISTVMIDEKQAAEDAVRLIASKGYSRILFICPPIACGEEQNVFSHFQRAEGVRDESARLSEFESVIISGNDYLDQMETLLNKGGLRTAILCSGDIYALKVMRKLEDRGFHIPDDVGVMGFDNIDMLEYVKPGLTTISTNVSEVAVAAVTELISQIENKGAIPKKIYLNHKILERESL